MKKIKVGCFGTRAHQIHEQLVNNQYAELAAVAAFDKKIPKGCDNVRVYETLDQLLADKEVDLVSFCSPVRAEQAGQAVKAMKAGKHVYAEKPCAMKEDELDAIIRTSKETGKQFHEMAGVAFHQPYFALRETVKAGTLGEVIQVIGQKCYPWTERRASDENVDGGLGMQVAIYLTRFVEHVACARIKSIEMNETKLGNPVAGHNCRMAVSIQMTLQNGGLAAGIANYLNPMGGKLWGYEIVRIFGTKGIVECSSETHAARLILNGKEPVMLETATGGFDYFDLYLKSLQGLDRMPFSMEEELSPARWIIRAKQGAKLNS
ncbi:MAG: hypothetical protein C0404_01745 [Verrucomicrobia bacterium]|nr:hypothetical protein [Verrucomicrobiota bacterium]